MFTVNESVKYFTKKGSKVYCGFFDATKAFDKVLHNRTTAYINKKAQLSLTNPRDAFWRIVVYGVGVFVCVNV